MIQKIKPIILSAVFALVIVLYFPAHSLAAVAGGDGGGGGKDLTYGNGCNGGVKACFDPKTNPIVKDLNTIVEFLAGLVGVVAVAMIIAGGVQFSASRNNPEAVKAAKSRITNALIALVVFMIMWGFLQWLIPGGVFG